jgi:hypothetical protein
VKVLAAVLTLLVTTAAHAAELIMVERKGCEWCARFDAEIAPGYPQTVEGKRAPLRRVDLHRPWPDGITASEGARFTPTFILVGDSGKEVGRFVGYPGDQFFYPALAELLKKLPDARP